MNTIHAFVEQKAASYVTGNVLDVGGGHGRWKSRLAPHAATYYISDLYAPEADFHDDARALGHADDSFDTVVCLEALEHIDDTEAVLREIQRVLKAGGHAIFTIPFLYPLHGNPDDFMRLTPHGLVYRLEKAGLSVIESGSIGNLVTVLGVFAKAKQKNYGRAGTPMIRWRERLAFIAHQILLRLDARFSYKDPHIFTHSYIIARK